MKLYKKMVACMSIAMAFSACSLTNYGLYYRSDFVIERHYAKLKKSSTNVLVCVFDKNQFSEKNRCYFFYNKNGKQKMDYFTVDEKTKGLGVVPFYRIYYLRQKMRTVRFDSDSIFQYYFKNEVEKAALNYGWYDSETRQLTTMTCHGAYFRMNISYGKKEHDYAIGCNEMSTDSTNVKMIFPKLINKELVRQCPELFK